MFQIKVINKTKHILCSVTFFFENLAVYEIISKNVVKPEVANNMVPARGIRDK